MRGGRAATSAAPVGATEVTRPLCVIEVGTMAEEEAEMAGRPRTASGESEPHTPLSETPSRQQRGSVESVMSSDDHEDVFGRSRGSDAPPLRPTHPGLRDSCPIKVVLEDGVPVMPTRSRREHPVRVAVNRQCADAVDYALEYVPPALRGRILAAGTDAGAVATLCAAVREHDIVVFAKAYG